MLRTVDTIGSILDAQLCCGCGACAAAAPDRYRMEDAVGSGRRPVLVSLGGLGSPVTPGHEAGGGGIDEHERRAVAACPGIALEHALDRGEGGVLRDLMSAWGPVYAVWEGYAGDSAIRHAGSSGGAATALALHAIERGGMHGVLHAAADASRPYLNRTVMSRSRGELLGRTGSRYAPASPCEGLGEVEAAPGPCVFIGKPCDVAGALRLAALRPALKERLGLAIAFFCAGTPSTRGTLDLLKKVGVQDPERVLSLRYRGNGWPGRWTVVWEDGAERREASLSYEESWGFLQKYRQWRCSICPDHTGEFADVAVGDPWYRPVEAGEPGKSLIVARTQRGLEAVRAAAADGYLVLEREDASLLPRSQPNLLRTRGRLWGQMAVMRLMGVPRPRYVGFPTFRHWLGLSLRAKVQSTVGTWRRVRRRGIGRGGLEQARGR